MALVAVHLGVVDEALINEMSYVFFEDILTELGHKLNYEAIVNYAGNSFCKDSWSMITEHNPMLLKPKEETGGGLSGIAKLFSSANVKIGKPKYAHK